MKIALTDCFYLPGFCMYAQGTVHNNNHSSTHTQKEAEFPGGPQPWFTFLHKNIHADIAEQHGAPAGTYRPLQTVNRLFTGKNKMYITR